MFKELAKTYRVEEKMIIDIIKDIINDKKVDEIRAIYESKSLEYLEDLVKDRPYCSLTKYSENEVIIERKRKQFR